MTSRRSKASFIDPILGSSREPVRFFIWATLGIAALAAVGVERLERSNNVSLRQGLILAGMLVVLSIPILCVLYAPAWSQFRTAGTSHGTWLNFVGSAMSS